jgi:hypothetical protein
VADLSAARDRTIARIVASIDWNPTCLPGGDRDAIVRQVLDMAADLRALAGVPDVEAIEAAAHMLYERAGTGIDEPIGPLANIQRYPLWAKLDEDSRELWRGHVRAVLGRIGRVLGGEAEARDIEQAIHDIEAEATGGGLLQPGAAFALGCLGVAVKAGPGWTAVDLARALAGVPTHGDLVHRPDRDSDVAAWIKRVRDEYPPRTPHWLTLDDLLDDYRLHADVGTPLSEVADDGTVRRGH